MKKHAKQVILFALTLSMLLTSGAFAGWTENGWVIEDENSGWADSGWADSGWADSGWADPTPTPVPGWGNGGWADPTPTPAPGWGDPTPTPVPGWGGTTPTPVPGWGNALQGDPNNTGFVVTPLPEDQFMIRAGVLYGSDIASGANCYAEYGMTIGWFDKDYTYTAVYDISERFLSFAKDAALSVSSNTVSDYNGSGTTILPYHGEIVLDFYSQQAVDSFIATLKNTGIGRVVFPAYVNGVFRVRIGQYATLADAQNDLAFIQNFVTAAAGYALPLTATGGHSNTITVIGMNTLTIVFEYDGTNPQPLSAYPVQGGYAETLFKNGTTRYYGYFQPRRMTGDNVTLVNVVELEPYVMGVVPSEVPSSWPIETLKTQAVAARCYAMTLLGKHEAEGYDLCTHTECQVYTGTANLTDRVRQAVEQTKGMVVVYNGEIITTYFSSTNGGYSENSGNVWYMDYPYYAAVPDPFEDPSVANWSFSVNGTELGAHLRSKGYNIGRIVDVIIDQRTVPANKVYSLTFVDEAGGRVTVTKVDRVRVVLTPLGTSATFELSVSVGLAVNGGSAYNTPLQDSYVLSASGLQQSTVGAGDVKILSGSGLSGAPAGSDPVFTFTGRGRGHAVGMSQYGAKGMAEEGFTYIQILEYYYTGTQVVSLYSL